MVPSAEEQVQFLLRIQRLLGEGLNTATYKYALLMAMADLSIELGDESGATLNLSVESIAKKFIEYYWRQTLPYLGTATLRQNKGRPPVVITLLLKARARHGDAIAAVQRDRKAWHHLVHHVAQTIREMPLRYLQNGGRDCLPFLYDQPASIAPRTIELKPGVTFCLRRFHGLIAELVQAAWTRWVRQQNLPLIGETADLHEFLFGSTRGPLIALQDPLREVQRNLSFYCHRTIVQQPQVDHFIPWALYPLDLGHNFILAHRECNSAKRDRLTPEEHLAAWVDRNRGLEGPLAREFDRIGVSHNLSSTTRIAQWAYSSVYSTAGLTWRSRENLVPLAGDWQHLLA